MVCAAGALALSVVFFLRRERVRLRFGFGGVSGSAVELVEFPEVETGVDAVVPCAGC